MDWADEKAKEILFEEIIEKEGQWTVVIAQALREAYIRGSDESVDELNECGHHICHQQSVEGVQSDGQEACADWCGVCIETEKKVRDARNQGIDESAAVCETLCVVSSEPDIKIGPLRFNSTIAKTYIEAIRALKDGP